MMIRWNERYTYGYDRSTSQLSNEPLIIVYYPMAQNCTPSEKKTHLENPALLSPFFLPFAPGRWS